MTERLLQFIWQFQYYSSSQLATSAGEPIQVVFQGYYNNNQGPDFTDAKIRIGDTLWAGTAELHVCTSDWSKHRHQTDRNYENVILHIVWEHDLNVNDIPVLELKGRVSRLLLHRYDELVASIAFIPCQQLLSNVPEIILAAWKERLLAERLLRKAATVEQTLQQNKFHWQETCWWLLARNFGLKVNADAFEAIARSLPLRYIARQRNQIHQMEALLLGQAGFLEQVFNDDYPKLLQREYRIQQRKYGCQPVRIPLHFLRMRPGNFPTIRLAQLAMLLHQSEHLFTRILEADNITSLRDLFAIIPNDYWSYHYRLDDPSIFASKKLGESMIDNIIVNTIAPLLFAYGEYHHEQVYKDRALQWLEQTSAEINTITKGFVQLGVENASAYDSQALIELKNEYCSKRRCLDCALGNALLKQTK